MPDGDECTSELLGKYQTRAFGRNDPFYSLIELTRKCNINCQHCYAVVSPRRAEMPTPRIKSLLGEIKKEGGLVVTFTGGEVTLRPDFLEILEHATDLRFAIQLFTNGTLIDERMADALDRLNIFQVGMSVYGASAATHDAVTRHPGSYDATIRAGTLLRDRGMPVIFKYVMMSMNMHEYEQMLQQSDRLDIRYKIDGIITPRDNGDLSTHSLRPSAAALGRLTRDRASRDFTDRSFFPADKDLTCTLGKTTASVTAYGEVYGCVAMPVGAGNVMERPFGEIWRGSPVLEEFRRFTTESLPVCRTCELRGYCNRCAGNAYTEHGDFYGPSSEACRAAAVSKALVDGVAPEAPEFEAAVTENLARTGGAREGYLDRSDLVYRQPCGDRHHQPENRLTPFSFAV